jgi:hypothetical protein
MACCALLACVVTAASAQIQENKPDPFLNGLVGSWDGPPVGGEEAQLSQVSTNGWRLNNRWMLLFVMERPFGKARKSFAAETYIGYDPEAKRYDAYVFDTVGTAHFTGTRVGEKSVVLSLTAADGHVERLTFTQESPTAYTRLLETSRDGTQFTTFASVRYTKRAGTAARHTADE